MKTKRFDGNDFFYEDGMPQIDGNSMDPDKPIFGDIAERIICELIVSKLEESCHKWNFADIGAHFGQFARIAVKRTTGKVHCFEPIRDIYEVLEKNCEEYDYAMIPYNIALYSSKCEMKMERSKNKYGGFNKLGQGDTVVNCDKMDNLNLKIDMMNIDVEGSGDEVLKGALDTLKDTKVIIFETHPGEKEYKDILNKLGFEWHKTDHQYIEWFEK